MQLLPCPSCIPPSVTVKAVSAVIVLCDCVALLQATHAAPSLSQLAASPLPGAALVLSLFLWTAGLLLSLAFPRLPLLPVVCCLCLASQIYALVSWVAALPCCLHTLPLLLPPIAVTALLAGAACVRVLRDAVVGSRSAQHSSHSSYHIHQDM